VHWGPSAATYPPPTLPCAKIPAWQRARVVAVASKYMGLVYKHCHVPAAGGLDCSNFTSWVYNYGLGKKFTSNVQAQAKLHTAVPRSQLVAGDLVYFYKSDGKTIGHVAMYVGSGQVIQEGGGTGKVNLAQLDTGWLDKQYAFSKRVIY
jgi:cell wall-associated NlpC family hydrolase